MNTGYLLGPQFLAWSRCTWGQAKEEAILHTWWTCHSVPGKNNLCRGLHRRDYTRKQIYICLNIQTALQVLEAFAYVKANLWMLICILYPVKHKQDNVPLGPCRQWDNEDIDALAENRLNNLFLSPKPAIPCTGRLKINSGWPRSTSNTGLQHCVWECRISSLKGLQEKSLESYWYQTGKCVSQ